MVSAGDVAGDGQAEAGAAAAPAAGAVEPGEALEDALAIRGGDAWPIVGDGEFCRGSAPENLDLHPLLGVSARVVHQIGHQPVHERGLHSDDDGVRSSQPDFRARGRLDGVGAGHGGKVDWLLPYARTSRDLREQEKVGGDRFEPVDVAKCRVEKPRKIGLAGVQLGLLELSLEPGEGRAKFMGGGGEPALG
jgi:hypothetical protein